MLIPAEKLIQLSTEILQAAGVPPATARAVANHLVEANLKGHDSLGVGLVPAYVASILAGHIKPHTHIQIKKDSGAVLSLEGGTGLGRVVGMEAMDLGMERARQHGISCIALGNVGHLGRIGAFAEYCADQGFVSTHYVNVVGHDPTTIAYGGRDRRFITNPFCCAVPRPGGEHVVLDMATTTIAAGKVRVAYMQGTTVPPNSLVDADGMETNDPRALFGRDSAGAMQPFGLHKGYGLMVMCELIGGALGGLFTLQPNNPRQGATLNNMLSIIIDPEAIGDVQAFQAEVESMIDHIYSSRPASGVDRVRLPGDPERESDVQRTAAGVDIDERSLRQILDSASTAGLEPTSLIQRFELGTEV